MVIIVHTSILIHTGSSETDPPPTDPPPTDPSPATTTTATTTTTTTPITDDANTESERRECTPTATAIGFSIAFAVATLLLGIAAVGELVYICKRKDGATADANEKN